VEIIRIAFVASTFVVGGTERVMFELITRLPDERYQNRLFFLKEPGPVGQELLRRGIQGESRFLRGKYDLLAIGRLSRRLRAFNPNICFCVDHRNAIVVGGLAAQAAHVPKRVAASHSTGKFGRKRNFSAIERLILRSLDRFVVLSEAHAEYTRTREGIDSRRITVIENGIDVNTYRNVAAEAVASARRELGLQPGRPVVSMVAALRPEKAHEALLQAARDLIAARPDLTFLLIGDGPRRGELERLSADLALGDRVKFLGVRGDVAVLLHLTDVLVLPSHPVVETLPLSVLEAMAAGVPVVASAVGSIPEVIQSGVNGRLIPPADPKALAAAVGELLSDEAARRAMAAEARRTVEVRYSAERMVSKYMEMFESL
jgi:glycosyltransferase involved in cell wall biosynthesis